MHLNSNRLILMLVILLAGGFILLLYFSRGSTEDNQTIPKVTAVQPTTTAQLNLTDLPTADPSPTPIDIKITNQLRKEVNSFHNQLSKKALTVNNLDNSLLTEEEKSRGYQLMLKSLESLENEQGLGKDISISDNFHLFIMILWFATERETRRVENLLIHDSMYKGVNRDYRCTLVETLAKIGNTETISVLQVFKLKAKTIPYKKRENVEFPPAAYREFPAMSANQLYGIDLRNAQYAIETINSRVGYNK